MLDGADRADGLVGYVSDEDHVAVAGAALEFTGPSGVYLAVSSASGAVRANLPHGEYTVAVAAAGHGSKVTRVRVGDGTVARFRLLRHRLLAYTWPKALRSGERCEIRVSSPCAYRTELWRYGWERRFVAHLGHGEHASGATAQVTPDGDYSTSGMAWNQAGLTLGPGVDAGPRMLTAPEASGLYGVHVHAADGSTTTCPLVVAPARPTAPVAVLASDLNWNAYNAFGGRSNYVHSAGLPPVPDVNRRQSLPRYLVGGYEEWNAAHYPPLSFDRPEPENQLDSRITDPITGRDACALAAAEWRLLGWMEREGFAHDLYSETQFAAGTLDLSRYRVLVLNCHPEYWTTGMYDRLKSWVRSEGGRLAYLGGNGINCPVTLGADNTMTIHNGRAEDLDPVRSRVDSRFGLAHEPEATLLGVGYTRPGLMSAAPYRVVAPEHWAFAGTGVREGDLIGRHTLNTRVPGGASGHETDKVSANSPAGVRVLARGTNPNGGGAEMATYDVPGGGAVFAAGSISFVTALPVDEVLSAVVRNVLTRFLDQPG